MALTASGLVGVDPAVLAADFRSLEFMHFPTAGFAALNANTESRQMPVIYDYKRHQLYIYAWAEPSGFTPGSPNVLNPWQYEAEVALMLQSQILTRYPISFNSANTTTTAFQTGSVAIPSDQIRSRAAIGGYSLNPLPNCYSLYVDNRNSGLTIKNASLTTPQEPALVYLPANNYSGQIDKVRVTIDPTKFALDGGGNISTLYVHVWVGINSYAD